MAELVLRADLKPRGAYVRTVGVWVAVTCALAVLISKPAQGQADQTQAQTPRWIGSLGIDPFNVDLRTRDPGVRGQLFATLGHQWARRGSGFGLRAQMTIGADLPTGLRVGEGRCGNCEVGYSRTFGALAGLAGYEWRRSAAIRPYVFGGPSLHVARTGFTLKGGAIRQSDVADVPLPSPATRWSAGITSGIGVALGLGRSTLFLEQWLQLRQVLSNMSVGRDRVVRPLSVGIRF